MPKRANDTDDGNVPKRATLSDQPIQCTHCSRNAFGRMLNLRCGHTYHAFCHELLTEAFGAHRCMLCFTNGRYSCGTIASEWDGPDAPS